MQNNQELIRGYRAKGEIIEWNDCKLTKEEIDEVIQSFIITNKVKVLNQQVYRENNGMIINEELFQKRCKQGAYLVYLLSDCEMGSEGLSGWMYYAVAHGSTDEEIYNDWVEQCKVIYGVDLSENLECINGKWFCYYELVKNELPSCVYGNSQPLYIEKCYSKHID